ncbi:pyridoxal 5'-phosphate synthase glutaminase subunit PdxT [Microbacterium binotii]|uniref:pyridoxal 5'-phosphate synthase glutaminase subunit PdxT n=1 Tax=Microbacterium binotii TaxID=462710 RepID=UPI002277ED79|nr:pyridoxal 5'-phosphate synthase glutaminase subunit PdxT [Microbacterium binotii]
MVGDAPRIGVLALQGDVREHMRILRRLGAAARPVRRPAELAEVDGLVIPGGESSVIDKLSRAFGMRDPLRREIATGLPVYGTCAGLILLADEVLDGLAEQQSFGGLDVAVRRNAFGSQLDSFESDLRVDAFGGPPVKAVFIRAPVVERVGAGVEILATLDDGRVVAVEQGNLLGTSFHPEVSNETRFHERLLERVRARLN